MNDDVRKRVASVIMRYCPNGGRLRTKLSNGDITEILRREDPQIDRKQVDEVLLEMAAVGFLWLSISSEHGPRAGNAQRIVVFSVMYPYGLELIA